MIDLLDLIVNERNHIGCEPWGKELLKTDFVHTTHFIQIDKSQGSLKYDFGSIRLDSGGTFSSILDFSRYSLIGKRYRESFEANNNVDKIKDDSAQEFSYQDTHLGINAQNIRSMDS